MTTNAVESEKLKKAIEKYELIQGEKLVRSDETVKIISILEKFLKKKGLMCYGGLALNNILPKNARFYEEHEMPDYDVYSSRPIKDLVEIADMYAENGYTNCSASSNPIHEGSYKLFVNFTGILDITYIPPVLANKLYEDRIIIDGISYTPVNFLRRSVYNELSNPEGDVSRFDKVYSRLKIVDKYYPVPEVETVQSAVYNLPSSPVSTSVYNFLINNITKYGGVFFGGYAMQLYSKYFKKDISPLLQKHKPLIYAFATNPKELIDLIESTGDHDGVKVSYIKHPAVSDVINVHYEIILDGNSVGVIFEPIGCHSFNVIRRNNRYVKIATIYTILHMYYSFIYIDAPYYNPSLLEYFSICLYNIKNSNKSIGILQLFPTTCYGHQHTKEDILSKRAELYTELKEHPNDAKMNKYFFKYRPSAKEEDSDEAPGGKYMSLENLTSSISSSNPYTKKDSSIIPYDTSKGFLSGLFKSNPFRTSKRKFRKNTFRRSRPKYNFKKYSSNGDSHRTRKYNDRGIFSVYNKRG